MREELIFKIICNSISREVNPSLLKWISLTKICKIKGIQGFYLEYILCGPPSHCHIWTVANLARWSQMFSKKNSLKICLVGLFIDQKEVFLDTKVNFGPEFALTIVDIHCRGISLWVVQHMNSVPFSICWPIWRG